LNDPDRLLGVVAALAVEARTLGPAAQRTDGLAALGDGALLAVSGMGASLAAIAARNLVAAGASRLLSFGLAGGLDPRLRAGVVVLPSEVISRAGPRFATAQPWCAQLRRALGDRGPVTAGSLLGSDAPIHSVADKARAFRETGAVAVDMESLAIAEVAAAHRLPFVAARVIVDTAADVLPRAVVAAGGAGQVDMRRLIVALAAAPFDWLALLRLAVRYRAATRSLLAVAAARAA
jgi:adenosylhomocysteine nucleosidase